MTMISPDQVRSNSERSPVRRVPSACIHDCIGRCALVALVKDGQVIGIESPFPEAPEFAEIGSGEVLPLAQPPTIRACARGRAYRQRLYHPDRLLKPLIRVGERGEGNFREATWDEALDLIAREIARIRDAYGPGSLFALSGSGHQGRLRGNLLAQRLLGLSGGFLGFYGNSSNGASQVATQTTYGASQTGHSQDDLVNSKLVVLWGANLADTHTGTGFVQHLTRARRAGARVIAIDPRLTETAAQLADEWLPVYPGTDAALVAAITYVMISEETLDRAFLHSHCFGFDELSLPEGAPSGSSYESYVLGVADSQPKSPEWTAEITGLPAERIRKLARELAATKPATILPGWGLQRAINGETIARSIMMLAAITGNVGIPGGGAAGVGNPHHDFDLARVSVPNPYPGKIPIFRWTDAVESPTGLSEAEGLTGFDGKDSAGGYTRPKAGIKLILNFCGNMLVNQHTNINRTTSLLADTKKVELIVVSEQFMTSSARLADVVLPACTWLEREDIVSGDLVGDYALYLQKAVEPLGESRTDYWMLAEIARRLGIHDEFTEKRSEIDWLRHLAAQSGITNFDSFRESGIYQPKAPSPFIAFADFHSDPKRHPLTTPSGKIELYSTDAAKKGDPTRVPAIPKYLESPEGRTAPLRERYPLQMVSPHDRFRTHSTLANLPWLRELQPDAVALSVADARARGIEDGDTVLVSNDRGAVELPARVSERIMPGVVFIPQGAWHKRRADGIDEGGCANTLTTSLPTAWSNSNTHHSALVEVASVRKGGGIDLGYSEPIPARADAPEGRLILDRSLCIDCRACDIACKDAHDLAPGAFRRRIVTEELGVFPAVSLRHSQRICLHCAEPECLAACPSGALVRDSDGVVSVVGGECGGCGLCVEACQYGGISLDPSTGASVKCDLCAERRARGEDVACVAACPMGALALAQA